MSDPIRDAVRSAIAEIVAEAPAPAGFDTHRHHRSRARGPLIAATAFAVVIAVVGVSALLRPPVPAVTDPVVEEVSSIHAVPTWLPEGQRLWNLTRAFGDASLSLLTIDSTTGSTIEITVSTTQLDADAYRSRLEAEFPDVSIEEVDIRGRLALTVEHPGDAAAARWEAVLVIENEALVTEVWSRTVDTRELVAVAQGLSGAAGIADVESVVGRTAAWDLSLALPPGSEALDSDTAGLSSSMLVRADPTRPTLVPEPTSAYNRVSLDTVYVTLDGSVSADSVAGAVSAGAIVGRSPAARMDAISTIDGGLEAVGTIPGTDPVAVIQAPESVTPTFAAAGLGLEQRLDPVDPAGIAAIQAYIESESVGRPITRMVAIGRTSEGVVHALLFSGERDYSPVVLLGDTGVRGAYPLDAEFARGLVAMATPDGHALAFALAPEAAVVQYVGDDGVTRLWQRPRLGFGVLWMPAQPSGVLIAFAADGTELERQRIAP